MGKKSYNPPLAREDNGEEEIDAEVSSELENNMPSSLVVSKFKVILSSLSFGRIRS